MFNVHIDQEQLLDMCKQSIEEKLEEVHQDLVLWDINELKRRTCMSVNTMKEKFFYDPDFPKFKVGNKWFFPAKETEAFLEKWAESNWKEQNHGPSTKRIV